MFRASGLKRSGRRQGRRQTALHGARTVESLESRHLLAVTTDNLASDWSDAQNPNQAWSFESGKQLLTADAEWIAPDQAAWTVDPTRIRQFHSAADLDFDGEFVYAVNAGGPATNAQNQPLVIGDAHFIAGNVASQPTLITANLEAANWYPDANYGATADDNNLEFVMKSIRWDRHPTDPSSDQASFMINLNVEPGQSYKLQMLFAELAFDRGFDIVVEGQEIARDFVISHQQGGINVKDTGVVFTHAFVARDNLFTVEFKGDAGVPNDDPIINGLTLEKLAVGVGAPSWFQLRPDVTLDGAVAPDFAPGDVIVRPTLAGSGHGVAGVTWTAAESASVTISGAVWTAAEASNVSWSLLKNDQLITSGTLLAGVFNRATPFDLRSGSGGVDAIRNLSVVPGDELRLTVTSDEAEYVGVDLSVASDSSGLPHFALGEIPDQDASAGVPVEFYIDLPAGVNLPTLQVVGLATPQDVRDRVSLSVDGRFTYTPSADQEFDLTVTLLASNNDGSNDWSQQFEIRSRELPNETRHVSQPGVLPDPLSDTYLTYRETNLHELVVFNT
ncbi:MAG: hypothetical protein KDA92_18265, partial [Planctomycetales bacterium]|nr:hypothetical protein [Planctomycetales bacterium]